MKKIGRNDPCPSGAGNKFKKCLAAHPCLDSQSSAAEIWWVCGRWQAEAPAFHELQAALIGMADLEAAKFDAFLELALADAPFADDFGSELLRIGASKGHSDLPGVFRRIQVHLVASGSFELPWFYSAAEACLWDDHPEMFGEFLEATLALDPATTAMESLENLVEWAVDLDRLDACEQLRERFPEFPEYLLMDPDEPSTAAEFDDSREAPAPDFAPEAIAAIEQAWRNFEALEAPSLSQAEAFVEELLALPHEATAWNEVFEAVQRLGQDDVFKIFHRLATALAPTGNQDFAYVCWSAVAHVRRLRSPQRLPEIARALLDFDSLTCDPDALSHIADALLGQGFVNETIELLIAFLPSLRDPSKVLGWVAPQVAEEILLMRLGVLIASGDYSRQPIDLMVADLCAGLDDDICEKTAGTPLRYLMGEGAGFSHEQFLVPGSTKGARKQELLWEALQQVFAEVARDEWLTAKRHPSITLIGLHMILRAVENWLASPREKGKEYPLNLLDYLTSAAMDRLVASECSALFGIKRERAAIMLDACVTLIRWTGRRALFSEKETAIAETSIAKLITQIGC